MWRRTLIIGTLVAMMAVPAWARNRARGGQGEWRPRGGVARCLHRMGNAAENHIRHMRGATQRCVVGIGQLVAEGRIEDAEALATECTQLVENQAAHGTTRVEQTAARCIENLSEYKDEPEALIELVTRTAEQAKSAMAGQLARSLSRIDEAGAPD